MSTTITHRLADGTVTAQTVDYGDGTGEHITFNPDGTVAATEVLTGLPIPPAEEPDPVAALQAQVAELQAALDVLLGVTP